jgi:hypothetical protein
MVSGCGKYYLDISLTFGVMFSTRPARIDIGDPRAAFSSLFRAFLPRHLLRHHRLHFVMSVIATAITPS